MIFSKNTEKWIRTHLPKELQSESLSCSGDYVDGLTVMSRAERGGPDTVVYEAKSQEDLLYWQLEEVCSSLAYRHTHNTNYPKKRWRYYRHHVENNNWLYIEHKRYDYNAIEDDRLSWFELCLRYLHYGLPNERWEECISRYTHLLNHWYNDPHWEYDREKLRFIEISSSKEHDSSGGKEEPRPGSVIKVVD